MSDLRLGVSDADPHVQPAKSHAVRVKRSKTRMANIRPLIDKSENCRLEFKLKVELGSPGAKAEFIRDILSLANSEGEHPRAEGYLVVGHKKGKWHDIADEHYDGATFDQILDSYITPALSIDYEEWHNGNGGRAGILIIKPDPQQLYIVSKRLLDQDGRALLLPGQSWGRRSARKVELEGEEICERWNLIADRRSESMMVPLRARIEKLETESGSVLDVKRIRFAMEGRKDWKVHEAQLPKLLPYAREFDHVVKHQILDAIRECTGRTRYEMPITVARAIDAVLGEVMPVPTGGTWRRTNEGLQLEDRDLLDRIGHLTYEMTWDACRYLRNLEIVEIGACRFWTLIRIATLNRLTSLKSRFLEDARHCAEICLESNTKGPFIQGQRLLDEQIRDALKIPTAGRQ